MWFRDFQRLKGRGAVFHLITRLLMSRGPMSRSELAEILNVSNATMTHISVAMIQAGALVEIGARPIASGRPPIMLDINHAGFQALGLVARSGRAVLVASDLAGGELSREVVEGDDAELPILVGAAVERALERGAEEGRRPVGLGAAILAGRDDAETIGAISALSSTSLPIRVDGEAAASATREALFGRAEGAGGFGVVAVGSTVDVVLTSGGVVGRRAGARGYGPAHVRVGDIGSPCVCGAVGCLHLEGGAASALADFAARDGTRLASAAELGAAAAAGNEAARAAARAAGERLGRGLTTLVDVADPNSLFIVGDGLALGPDYLDAAIAAARRDRGFDGARARTDRFDDAARALDAASLVIDDHVRADEAVMPRQGRPVEDLGKEKNESTANAAAPRVHASSPQLSR